MGAGEREPWAGAMHAYVGWVPNVRSHLSFSLISSARRAEAFTAAFKGRAERLVLVYEERISHDVPMMEWLIRRRRPDLIQHWMLVGRTQENWVPTIEAERAPADGSAWLETERDRQGMLRGKVHVLPHQEVDEARARQVDAVAQIRRGAGRPSSLREGVEGALNEELERLQLDIEAQLLRCDNRHEIEFALLRTGELRLWYSATGVQGLDEVALFRIAEQAYFFVKDAVHDHTHHDPSSDQITPLTRIRPIAAGAGMEADVDGGADAGMDIDPDGRPEAGHGDEVAWRRETLWSLSREVERLQRKGGLVSLRQSLGVLAYAEAFQTYLMGHERSASSPTGFRRATSQHNFEFRHLKDSVNASIDVASTKQSQAVQVILAGGGTFISMASLATAMANAHNAVSRAWGESKGDYVGIGVPGGILRFLVANPLLAGLLASIALLIPVAYTFADGEGGLFNPRQRVLSQLARAASVSLGGTDRSSFWIDLAFHGLMVLLSMAVVVLLLFGLWWAG